MTTSLLNTFNNLGLATTASSNTAGTGAANGPSPSSSLTQSDFLKLLTTQLTHQDPTNPTDSNAYFNQMSQFSMVSGIQNMVSSLKDLSSSLSSDQALQASGLVGQYVSVPGSQALLAAGGAVAGDFDLSGSTPFATVTITNSATGETVRQIDLGAQAAGNVAFTWDGKDSNGALANPGVYNVKASALIDGTNTAVATNIQSKVGSVTIGTGGSGLQLNLDGLGSVPFSKVQKII